MTYKSKFFDTAKSLVDFLNKNKIKKSNIIQIYCTYKGSISINHYLIYVEEDNETSSS